MEEVGKEPKKKCSHPPSRRYRVHAHCVDTAEYMTSVSQRGAPNPETPKKKRAKKGPSSPHPVKSPHVRAISGCLSDHSAHVLFAESAVAA